MLDTMEDIAAGKKPVRVNGAIRLVVFGFDFDELKGEIWKRHHEKLSKELADRLLIRGTTSGFTKGISASGIV